MMTAEEIIACLGLRPLPIEGGYFAETYRAPESLAAAALPPRYPGPRSLSTSIYYLLTPTTCSILHRLRGDEVYHFYLGDPVELVQLCPDGRGERLILGPELRRGERPQAMVPAGTWQGSRLVAGGRVALLGTTMAPGFDLDDFEAGDRAALLRSHPAFRAEIEALTRAT
jgi:hypothetical protein